MSLVFCLFLFILFDFIDKSKHYYPVVNAEATYIFLFYLCQTPYLIVQCSPLASLASSALVMYSLGRSNEMTAMLSFGYSPRKLLYPVLCCGFIVLIGLFFFSECIVPISSRKAHYITKVIFEDKPYSFINKTYWSRNDLNFYSYSFYNPEKKTFNGLKIISIDESFRLKKVEEIEKAIYLEKERVWDFRGIKQFSFLKTQDFLVVKKEFAHRVGRLPVSADILSVERRQLQELSLSEISSIIDRNKESGMDLLEIYVIWHIKIAYLFVSFLFVFCGFKLAFISERKKDTMMVFFSLIVLGLAYWFLFSLSRAAILSGFIPSYLGAWIANFFLACYLIFQTKKSVKGFL